MVTIYALKDNGQIFYIGQTIDIEDRMNNHRSGAKYCRNNKEKYVNDLLNDGRKLSYEILELCEVKQGIRREHFYIKHYIKLGVKLLNKKISKNPQLRYVNTGFTDKEKNLLQSMANDMTISQIAKQVGKSARTLEGQVKKIKKKLGAKSIAGLIKIAYNKQLVR